MGITPQAARHPRPAADAATQDAPRRLSVREARVRCIARDGRLLIMWRVDSATRQVALTASFREAFPTHGETCWRKRDRVWSVPLRLRDRLAEWVTERFEPGCELGYLPWDDTPRPAYMTEAG